MEEARQDASTPQGLGCACLCVHEGECVCLSVCVSTSVLGEAATLWALRMSASELLRHQPSNWLFPEGSALQQGEPYPRPGKPGLWSASREGWCALGLLSSGQSLRRQLRA